MDIEYLESKLDTVLSEFRVNGKRVVTEQIKNGHINCTFRVTVENDCHDFIVYVVQAINTYVFKNPVLIMENIDAVTAHIKNKYISNGLSAERKVLDFLHTSGGKNYYYDDRGNFWRAYLFVYDSATYDLSDDPQIIYNTGVGFGTFQKLLSDFPADRLGITIPDFHNTRKRMDDFFETVESDALGRCKDVMEEIEFFRQHRETACRLQNLLDEGKLPLRVTHNDTKCNNVLMDDTTGEALCVIDLDTIMPGLSVFDFGDAVRFACNTAAEDETDLSKVTLNISLYEQFTRGFIEPLKGFFGEVELENMAWGALIITIELASRFLKDHIEGDKYFRIHHPNHNLERARNQIALAKDMEKKFDQMCEIVRKYS